MHWVFWAMAGASVAHAAEEYLLGWLDYTRGLSKWFARGINLFMFLIVNAAVILLCVMGALAGLNSPMFSLSIATLFLINTAMHLVPMIITRRYSPGSVSALFLYLPLALYAFHVVDRAGKLNAGVILGAILLGLLWQALPVGAVFFASTLRDG